jgi:uncharacterized protein (TIGR03067 family)
MKARAWVVLGVALLLAAGAPSKDELAKKDLDAMKGSWQAVGGEEDGKPVKEEDAKQFKLVLDGDKYTFTIENMSKEEGTLKLDPGQKPKAVDVMITTGTDKGKTQLGVYDIEGDTLKLCFVPPGAERPRALAAKEGSMSSLFIFKRQKP